MVLNYISILDSIISEIMTSEFPNACLTSTTSIHGFVFVAYAVCVAANVGHQVQKAVSDSASDTINPRTKNIARLRAAEYELREAAILVALDPTKGELFTFYRKDDLQKDAKDIFARLGTILRTHTCTISYKSVARAEEMLTTEHARLYGLFTTAIMASMRYMLVRSLDMISINPRTFVRYTERDASVAAQDGFLKTSSMSKCLDCACRMTSDGQIQFTMTTSEDTDIQACTDREDKLVSSVTENRAVVLAPSGQLARFLRIVSTEASDSSQDAAKGLTPELQALAKLYIKQESAKEDVQIGIFWLEVEVPLLKSGISASASTAVNPNAVLWRKLYWPANFAFIILEPAKRTAPPAGELADIIDPLSFAEQWTKDSDKRKEAEAAREIDKEKKRKRDDSDAEDNQEYFSGDMDMNIPLRRASAIVQNSSLVYPTPPEGGLTQATPGMSSIDGLVMTPVAQYHHQPGSQNAVLDADITMPNNDEFISGHHDIGTGLYDEDLFEEMPGENFGSAAIGDEPDWDFFGEHTLEIGANAELEEGQLDHGLETSPTGLDDDMLQSSEQQRSPDVPMENVKTPSQEESANEMALRTSPASVEPASDEIRQSGANDSMPPPALPTTKSRNNQTSRPSAVHERRQSFLEALPTSYTLSVEPRKYHDGGRFWFEGHDNRLDQPPQALNVPLLAMPARRQNALRQDRNQLKKRHHTPDDDQSTFQDSDSSTASDVDNSDSSVEADKISSPQEALRRKWSEYTPYSSQESQAGHENIVVEEETPGNGELFEILRPAYNDLSLLSAICSFHAEPSVNAVQANKEIVHNAQILLNQITFSTCLDHCAIAKANPKIGAFIDIAEQLEPMYGNSTTHDLASMTRVEEEGADDDTKIVKLDDTHIKIRRQDQILVCLPEILPFWDTLSLEPHHGPKNITAFCLHPCGPSIAEGSMELMVDVSNTYASCHLGVHRMGKLAETSEDGLLSWNNVNNADSLGSVCDQLVNAIVKEQYDTGFERSTIMVYIIQWPNTPERLLDICDTFRKLCHSYGEGTTKNKGKRPDIALQIIPMSLVASRDAVVIPSRPELFELAMQIYGRCPCTGQQALASTFNAAVSLSRASPTGISFNLNADVKTTNLSQLSTMFLAYAMTPDGRWISACWTDSLGEFTHTAAYCMRFENSDAILPISDIIKEMLNTSLDMTGRVRTRWRLIVTKYCDGPMNPEELNSWKCMRIQTSAVNSQFVSSACICDLYLTTIDDSPPIHLSLPPIEPKTNGEKAMATPTPTPGQINAPYGRPGSTPQQLNTSPEQLTTPTPIPAAATAATPPQGQGHADHNTSHNFDPNTEPDLTLSDPTNSCWSVVLAHGLDLSRSNTDARPAHASGLLVKRGNGYGEPTPLVMALNVLDPPFKNYEERSSWMQETLAELGRLTILAKIRGNAVANSSEDGKEGHILPWHVAAVKRTVRMLEYLP